MTVVGIDGLRAAIFLFVVGVSFTRIVVLVVVVRLSDYQECRVVRCIDFLVARLILVIMF